MLPILGGFFMSTKGQLCGTNCINNIFTSVLPYSAGEALFMLNSLFS